VCRDAPAVRRGLADGAAPARTAGETGFSMIELLVASSLALIVALALYDFFDSGYRSFVRETDLADAQNAGRVALDLFAADARAAGLSPIGAGFYAVPAGNASRVRFLSDRDGDALVGAIGETDESLSYVFSDPDGDGLYTLVRGADYNEDWDFNDVGESSSVVTDGVVRVDFDGDGTAEPFLSYFISPPAASQPFDWRNKGTANVVVTFGVRSRHRDAMKKQYAVFKFQSDIDLRNREY